MPSNQDTSISQFRHQIQNIQPTELSVPTDRHKIQSRCEEMQSANGFRGEVGYGKKLSTMEASYDAKVIAQQKARTKNLQHIIQDSIFTFSRLDSKLTTGEDRPPPASTSLSNESRQDSSLPQENLEASTNPASSPKALSNLTQTSAKDDNPRSPLLLGQLELTREIDIPNKTVLFDISGPQAKTNDDPTSKGSSGRSRQRARSEAPTPNPASSSFGANIRENLINKSNPKINQRAGSKASTTSDSSVSHVTGKAENKEISTLSFGLKTSVLAGKFPRAYMRKELSTFFTNSEMCADFFRVAFTVREDVQIVRQNLVRHAQATILENVSIERADDGEDKSQLLQDMCYLGCIFYDANVEFWEVKYTPRGKPPSQTPSSNPDGQPSKIPLPAGPSQNRTSSQGQQLPQDSSLPPHPPCEVHVLGSLDLSQAADVKLCSEFVYHIMRWGLTKYCMAYVDNLHRMCWMSEREDLDPGRMSPEETNTYWSS